MKHHSIQWKTLHHQDQESHMSWYQVQTVLIFFYHKGICSFWVYWTESNNEPALLLGNTGMVHLRRPELQPCACVFHHDSSFALDVLMSGTLWLKNWYWNLTILCIHQIWPCVTYGCSEIENHFAGSQIFRHCQYLWTCDNHSEENFRREVPALFWRVKTLTDWMYYSAGRWLWRWWELLVCKVMKYIFYRGFTETLSHLVCLQFVVLQYRHVFLAVRGS